MNNNKQTKKSLIYSFMLGMGVCSRIVAFGATYTWQAVDGVWDGNISDPAHWRCDTAGSPGYEVFLKIQAELTDGATEIELGDFKVYEIGGPLPVWAPEFERPKERR